MARLAVLAFSFLLVGQCKATGLFEEGQEYQYSYLAYTNTGVREPEASGSSFGIKGTLIVQKNKDEAIVKITDVKLGMHNGPEFLFGSIEFVKKPELAVLEKPFRVSYTNGKVSGFDADADDTAWSINIKKGLATSLQVDHSTGDEFGKDENAYMRTVEETVTGTCNTSYSFGAAPKGRFALIKQRSMADCLGVPRLSRNTYEAKNCEGKLQDELLATTQGYYQLTRQPSGSLKPYYISSLGYQVLQWHPPAGAAFYNLANTTMILKSTGAISKPITGEFTQHFDTLRFSTKYPIPSPDDIDLTREEDFTHPQEPLPQDLLRTKVNSMMNQLVRMIGSSPLDEKTLTDPSVTAAINQFSYLSLDSLKNIFESMEGNEEMRNLFVEILPLCGSNPAAIMLKEMILEGKLHDLEARRAIAYMPFYLRLPSEKLLSSYEELLKENPKIQSKKMRAAIAMAYGHLVGITCSANKHRPCKTDTLNKYSRIAFEAFKNAKSHPEQMVTLLALRNTKIPSAIERLIPYIKSGVVSRALRPHVIYALSPLAHANRDKFLAAVMPIVLNMTETTEIRVAAIATIFDVKPTFLELQQLIAVAVWERNLEVRNFIITTFRNYAQSKNPCMSTMAPKIELLLRRVAHIQTSHFRSSNRVFDYADQKYGFGGGLQLVTVYGEESRAPLIIAGRVNYRVSSWAYTPLEVFIRLEGVEDAYVRMFRKLDPKDFKMDVLKDLLQKTLKIMPRQQQPLKMEIVLRSQGYNIFYRHAGMEEIMSLLSSNTIGQLVANGLKTTRNMVLLGGQHTSWRSNDLGLPIGVGLSNPGLARVQLGYGDVNQPGKFGRSLQADVDFTLQVQTYLVAYNPLGVSQGIIKIRGSRLHLPTNALLGVSAADKELELKMNTPTKEKPLSILFSSKAVAIMWGREAEKAVKYLKESCSECKSHSLITRGEEFRKGHVLRNSENERLGMESHVEVYDCESYTGKSSMSRVFYESFKPSEINSHGSIPGWAIMGFMQMRNYFYYYPPTTTCSMKAVVHKTEENPAEAVQIKMKMNPSVAGKRGSTKVEGTVTFLGEIERKWNVDVSVEREHYNVKSTVNVKIARQAVPSLNLAPRALCVEVKTKWADLPEDIMQTPSTIEPSVQRDVSFVWGEAPANECPTANAKDISTFLIRVTGNITDAQRQAAESRDRYPYKQCDQDKSADGRSGVVVPFTEACMASVMEYGTPRSYVFDIHYANISPLGMKAMHRMDTIIKAGLAPYWDMHAPHGTIKKDHNSGRIEMKVELGEEAANIHVHTALMHSHYEGVDLLRPLQYGLRNARVEISKLFAYKTGLTGVCNVAPESVVTFDNVTLRYECPTCYTLISADCSAQPRYAVFAKKTDKTLPLAMKIYAGGHFMEFTPTEGEVEVRANGKVVSVESGKPYILADKDGIIQYFRVNKVGEHYYVDVPMLMLSFRYTGDDITNMIPATHRAQHCGMCGDFNGQHARELVAPSGCTMKDASDLARSYVLRDKNCKDSIRVPTCQISYNNGKNPSGIVDFLGQFSNTETMEN